MVCTVEAKKMRVEVRDPVQINKILHNISGDDLVITITKQNEIGNS